MRIALLQMTSGIDPAVNAADMRHGITAAAANGAGMVFLPEMAGLIDRDRARAAASIHAEADDPVLASVRETAAVAGLWVHVGSLAVRRDDGRYANRSFVIDAAGEIRARYDKLHLFDVDLPTGESWRESAAYAPGDAAVVVDTPVGPLGLSICYDLRFPALYAAAHWHALMRARAIETGCFVVAAAQAGAHADGRTTYGHSLVIDPWGDVLLDMGEARGLGLAEIDPARVADVRARIPVLDHARAIPPVTRA
jgi:predicted amidohydrolase